ncbi:MAG TPA: isoprenylcysteine carboxylmethyltransferase family protein [Chthoniobacteraceae bacterium]|nr:isoprenylcysteine carboxylmethyltransferase family protein [Chthoniobacteraceae bacterium]
MAAALTVAGLAFAVWARRTIADNWSSDVEFKQSHKLVQHGPYGLVRHPIYTGLLLMVLGSAIAGGRVASLLAVPCFFTGFWIKLKMEERLMLRHFPGEYPGYQRRVKALVPGVL